MSRACELVALMSSQYMNDGILWLAAFCKWSEIVVALLRSLCKQYSFHIWFIIHVPGVYVGIFTKSRYLEPQIYGIMKLRYLEFEISGNTK